MACKRSGVRVSLAPPSKKPTLCRLFTWFGYSAINPAELGEREVQNKPGVYSKICRASQGEVCCLPSSTNSDSPCRPTALVDGPLADEPSLIPNSSSGGDLWLVE